MYLWKYWRDTRVVFGISVLLIALLFALLARWQSGSSHSQWHVVLYAILSLQTAPALLLAWIMGSHGVGRDLGERAGSYLFTRARSRASFVWRDWAFGAAQIFVVVVLLNLVVALELRRLLASGQSSIPATFIWAGRSVTIGFAVGLNIVAIYLAAALVFGLTYLCTILLKSWKGLMLAVGSLVAYGIGGAVAHHYWPQVNLPNVVATIYPHPRATAEDIGFADHLGLSLALRAAVVLVFPIAAQLVLEKADL